MLVCCLSFLSFFCSLSLSVIVSKLLSLFLYGPQIWKRCHFSCQFGVNTIWSEYCADVDIWICHWPTQIEDIWLMTESSFRSISITFIFSSLSEIVDMKTSVALISGFGFFNIEFITIITLYSLKAHFIWCFLAPVLYWFFKVVG